MPSTASGPVLAVGGLTAACVGAAAATGDPAVAGIAIAYVASALAALPVAAVTMIAGYAFGVGWGMAVVAPVALVGALAGFGIGRTLLRGRIERRFGHDARFAAIDRAIGAQGFRITFLARLSPVLPFGALNYALSATSVRPGIYAAGTALGMLPGTLLYVYLGSIAGGGDGGGGGTRWLWWIGLAATVLAVALVARAARRALRQEQPS